MFSLILFSKNLLILVEWYSWILPEFFKITITIGKFLAFSILHNYSETVEKP